MATITRPWGTLDNNILLNIFLRLTPYELFFKTSLVSRSWRSAFWEVLFWKDHQSLDLFAIKHIVKCVFCSERSPGEIFHAESKYSEMLLAAMESILTNRLALGDEQRRVKYIEFPRNMHISGLEDLTFLAKRTQSVENLVFKDAYSLKDGCFSEALKYWKRLEKISIGPIFNHSMVHIIKELSINCRNLQVLHLDMSAFKEKDLFRLNAPNANLIATHLLQLKEFWMVRGVVHRNGVSIILRQCQQLLTLCLIRSEGITTSKKGRSFKRLISVKIIRKQVKGFVGFKWRVDSIKKLLTSDEVIHRLFRIKNN